MNIEGEKKLDRVMRLPEIADNLGVCARSVRRMTDRGELKQLRWADLDLDASAPLVKVRAAISKNHRQAVLPLHSDLAAELRKLRLAECNPESFVFKGLFPRNERFHADLKAAGIDPQDKGGGRLDFHSLRVTYCTELGPLGGSERIRMEPMRHHDPRLTAETYTDARMLPLGDAVAKLSFHRNETGPVTYAPISAQTRVQSRQPVSSLVTETAIADGQDTLVNRGEKSLPVIPWRGLSQVGEWCAVQDLNL